MSETDSLIPKVSIRTAHRCSAVGVEILTESERQLIEQSSSASLGSLSDGERNGVHCHATRNIAAIDKKARNRLIIASILCLVFMVGEIVGGIIAGSLAIVSDAAHLLTDFASFMVSLLALFLASRQPTKKLSFGWYRAEILGALSSILMLWILTGIVVYMAIKRIISNEYEIKATIMLVVAGCGVAFNLFMGLTLHQHSHSHGGHSHKSSESDNLNNKNSSYSSINDTENPDDVTMEAHHSHQKNINVRAAFIHVIGDLIQSIGVLIAALIIFFKPDWKIADPVCTFVFSVIVLVTTISVVRDILIVLMEGTPRGLSFVEVKNSFYRIPGVKDLHDLRMWSLSLNKVALSVHIAVDKNADPLQVLKLATAMVQKKYGIAETTIQVEEYIDEMENCTHCKELPD